MMELPVIYIWSHDSISLGEDGPTHQPVEQLASLRAMPGMIVLRPADANEVVESWRLIMRIKDRPVSLVLTRQSVPTLDRTRYAAASGVGQGAYILADAPDHQPDVLLLATGSEVTLCIAACELLAAEGIKARVISMPSWELFESQSQEYRDSVLPPHIAARIAVEEGSTFGWERYRVVAEPSSACMASGCQRRIGWPSNISDSMPLMWWLRQKNSWRAIKPESEYL